MLKCSAQCLECQSRIISAVICISIRDKALGKRTKSWWHSRWEWSGKGISLLFTLESRAHLQLRHNESPSYLSHEAKEDKLHKLAAVKAGLAARWPRSQTHPPVSPQQSWPNHKREVHIAHRGDTSGAPSSGDQEGLCHWAAQDTCYIRPLF